MVKGAASQVLQVPPLKSGVYLGYGVCFDVYKCSKPLSEYNLQWYNGSVRTDRSDTFTNHISEKRPTMEKNELINDIRKAWL